MTMEAQDADECGSFRIIIAADGSRALHASRALAPGDLLGTFSIAALVPRPTRYSIQLGAFEHALVEPEAFRLINHSCVPNLLLDARGLALRAVRPIEPGHELTYFYPSTEWRMAEPFACHCGEPRCLGWIAGAAHLPVASLRRYDLADHISLLLEQRRGKPAAPGEVIEQGHAHA